MSKIVLKNIKLKSQKTKFYGELLKLRWWRLPIEERVCSKTDLDGGDYYLRNSGLPPSIRPVYDLYRTVRSKQTYTQTVRQTDITLNSLCR